MMNLKKVLSIFIDEEVRIQIGEKIIHGADYRDIKDYLKYEVASVSPSVYNNYLLITLNEIAEVK